GILRNSYEFEIEVYDVVREKKLYYPQPKDKSIYQIIEKLIKRYGERIGKIVIADNPSLKLDELETFRQENFEKYIDIVCLATEEKLNFKYYLTLKVRYSVGDLITVVHNDGFISSVYCKTVSEGMTSWTVLDKKYSNSTGYVDFEYIKKIFHLK